MSFTIIAEDALTRVSAVDIKAAHKAAIMKPKTPGEDIIFVTITNTSFAPTFSGITPETNHWFWNEQLPRLCNDDFYRKQVEAEIEEIDMKATNIRRQMANQMEVWETESKTLEMKSEKLKEILLDSKKKLNLQET